MSYDVFTLYFSISMPLEDKNLNIIKVMKKLFNEDVGFSGHGTGIEGTLRCDIRC